MSNMVKNPTETSSSSKEPKTMSDVWSRFVDTTSLQGISFLSAATRWYAKALWTLILFSAVAILVSHSIILIYSYLQFETSSQVDIKYESVNFPTITLCNINPVRASKVHEYGHPDLEELLFELLHPPEEYVEAVRYQDDVFDARDFAPFRNINLSHHWTNSTFEKYLDGFYSTSTLGTVLLTAMISELPAYNRTQMGHQLSDMLLACSYDGIKCGTGNFSTFLDINHGNCFSFNSPETRSRPLHLFDSGSSLGLHLVLYIEHDDYIKGIQQGRGLRVFVHPFGTQPFVEESGFAVPTGFQTFAAMRQLKQSRLGGKYGKCGDEGRYEKYFDGAYAYRLDACTHTCTDRTISEDCHCIRDSHQQFYSHHDQLYMKHCTTLKEMACMEEIEGRYSKGKLHCDCHQACRSDDYDYTLSYDQWPDESLWFSLINAVCSSAGSEECDRIRNTTVEKREDFLGNNFLHLKMYFKDLNVEQITEVAAYESVQFYSDIGGVIGLWLGASVITIFEIVDLLIRCVQFCFKRGQYRTREHRNSVYT